MSVKLGKTYRDPHTGFEGMATARTEYLYGCVRVCLEASRTNAEGATVESWFDEQRLDRCWFDEQRLDRSSAAPVGGPAGPVAPARSTG